MNGEPLAVNPENRPPISHAQAVALMIGKFFGVDRGKYPAWQRPPSARGGGKQSARSLPAASLRGANRRGNPVRSMRSVSTLFSWRWWGRRAFRSFFPFFIQRRCAPGGTRWIATSMRSSQ
jgi:hypothetical protein